MHFIEVKATNGEYEAIYRVTPLKLEKLLKTIRFYLMKNDKEELFELDVLVVDKGGIRLVENITS